MSNIATHMRITGLHVTNEDVDSRKAAVETLKAAWRKLQDVGAIVAKAAEIAEALGNDGIPNPTLGDEVQEAIQEHASAFLHTERPLDVGIVAGMTAIELMAVPPDSSDWLIFDLWAAALWSALAFQPTLKDGKREALRASVLEAARTRSVNGAEMARQRSVVKDFGEVTITADEQEKLTETFKKATAATIQALRRNAALDREELDFLWWAQLNRSRLLNRPLLSLDEPVRVVAAGIEAAAHLRRLPCEVHRDVVLRTLDANPKIDLPKLLALLGDDRAVLGEPYLGGLVARVPGVFPLLHALATGSTATSGAKVKRTAEEWGARGLLEAGLMKMHATGPVDL